MVVFPFIRTKDTFTSAAAKVHPFLSAYILIVIALQLANAASSNSSGAGLCRRHRSQQVHRQKKLMPAIV